jgi:type VI secretion system protein ImpH
MSTPAEKLFDSEAACGFDPFRAVQLLEQLANDPPLPAWKDADAAVRFRGNVTLSYPPSHVAQIVPPEGTAPDPENLSHAAGLIRGRYTRGPVPQMVLNFVTLFGTNGTLPVVYTKKLIELDAEREYRRTSSRTALRDWLDIFNHRYAVLLYKAWTKYRMPVGFLKQYWQGRGGAADYRRPADRVTQVVMSLAGLGVPGLRDRIRIEPPSEEPNPPALARIEDSALLHYAAAFARRRPGAYELSAILSDYFALPVNVITLTGQWLDLPPESQTQLDGESALGLNSIAGERVWDVGSKFRLRIGPLRYLDFDNLLPDPTPVLYRKAVYLLSQLTRLYVGAEYDFEIQLVLHKYEVPPPVLRPEREGELGMRLGWNSWMPSDAMADEVDDVLFDAPCEITLPAA